MKNETYKYIGYNQMSLDQFYTTAKCAKKYYDIFVSNINIDEYDIILEPSAGTGSFYKLLPENKRIGIDLEPKYGGIEKKNFFDFVPIKNKSYIVIGNPPFGKISSIAVDFFNKSAEFADIIAFILHITMSNSYPYFLPPFRYGSFAPAPVQYFPSKELIERVRKIMDKKNNSKQ